MTTDSSILAWKIPWTEEPGRLQSMGSQFSDRMTTTKKRIALFVCQAKDPQQDDILKAACPSQEVTLRNFTVMVQRGSNQLLAILLIGW